jgi:hypothetical protein
MRTAVEWLVEEMFKQGYLNDKPLTIKNIESFFKQAKEMEKEQIINAVNYGDERGKITTYRTAEQYYNETFKSE